MILRGLHITQIILSVLLTISILMQVRGSGLSSVFGGSGGGEYFRTRRGIEKFLFYETIFLSILFVACAVASLIIKK